MEQLQRWRSMAKAMCGSSCHRSASDEPRSGKRQKPDAINALRRDIAIATAMGLNLNRVVCIDGVEPSCSSLMHGSLLHYGNYRLSSEGSEGNRSKGKSVDRSCFHAGHACLAS
jgi:hypothetical protein